jgi:hypothetical protein
MNHLREVCRQICDPRTPLGRVPAWVYGFIWSFAWGSLALAAFYCAGIPATFFVALLSFFITLKLSK